MKWLRKLQNIQIPVTPRSQFNTHLIYINVIVSFILAAFMTFSVYPYIFTADGGSRLSIATQLFNKQPIGPSLLSQMQTVMMYLCYKASNNYSLYTFLQSFLMLFSLSCLTHRLIALHSFNNKIISYIWFLISLAVISFPITLVFSVILTDSSGVIVGLSLILCLMLSPCSSRRWVIGLYGLLMLLCFTITFGFRMNSLILAPLILLLIMSRNVAKIRRYIEATAMIVSLLIVFVYVPYIIKVPAAQPQSLSFAWELVGIAKDSADPEEKHLLDFIGDTEEAIKRYDPHFLNAIFWDSNPPLPSFTVADPKVSREITKLYIKVMLSDPLNFIQHKLKVVSYVSGIKEPLLDIRRGVHDVDQITMQVGALDTGMNKYVRSTYSKVASQWSFIVYRPYVLFIISTALIVALYYFLRRMWVPYLFVYLFASLYYFGFFLNTQAMEFRYYAPTFFILLVMCLCAIAILIDEGIKRRTKQRMKV